MTQPTDPNMWQAPPPGWAPQPAPVKKKRKWPKIVGGFVGAFFLLIIISATVGNNSSSNSTTASGSSAPTADATLKNPATYQPISSRAWQELVKDPDSHKGQRIIVYANVTQFDSATGTGAFRADVSADPGSVDPLNATNTMFVGDQKTLGPVVQGDIVKVYATVDGAETYTTTMGGNMAVPKLTAQIVEQVAAPTS